MEKTLTALVAALALVGVASMASASNHWEDDRELTYVGSWSPVYRTCDDSDGHQGTGFHGVGGGIFCGVLTGRSVTVTVNDAVLDEPLARASCAWEREQTPFPPEPFPEPVLTLTVTTHEILAEANPSATFDVPSECLASTEDGAPEGSTDIGIFPESHDLEATSVTCCSFTTGTVTLVYN